MVVALPLLLVLPSLPGEAHLPLQVPVSGESKPLIVQYGSSDLNGLLTLIETDHVDHILDSDWSDHNMWFYISGCEGRL